MLSATEAYKSVMNSTMQVESHLRALAGPVMSSHQVACLIWAGKSKELTELLSNGSADSLDRRAVPFDKLVGHMPTSWKNLRLLMFHVWEYAFLPNDLETPIPPFQTPPLMLAAMCSDAVSTRALLAAGVSPDAVDRRGWRATHHAAMHGDGAVLKLLLEARADLSARNDEEGTVADLRAIISTQRPDPNERNVRYWDERTKQVVKKSALELFGEDVCFSEQTYVSVASIIKAWSKELPAKKLILLPGVDASKQTTCQFEVQFKKLHREEPKVYVGKCVTDGGHPLPKEIGLGLYADADFAANDFICSYGGEGVDGKSNNDKDYLLGKRLNARRVRYYGAIANDSFPNATYVLENGMEGCQRGRLRAVTTIRRGEAIRLSFGPAHPTKWATHFELAPNAMRSWLLENPLNSFLEGGKNDLKPMRLWYLFDIRAAEKMERLVYILATPTALCSLGLEGLVTTKQIDQLRQYAVKLEDDQQLFGSLATMEEVYMPFFKAYEKLPQDTRILFSRPLQVALASGDVQAVFRMMHALTGVMKQKVWQKDGISDNDGILDIVSSAINSIVNPLLMELASSISNSEPETTNESTSEPVSTNPAKAKKNAREKARKAAVKARRQAGGSTLDSKGDGKQQ